MPDVLPSPPLSRVDPVTDIVHGIPVTDPYRWLEDQDSPRTREWLDEQTAFARAYLDGFARKDEIRHRIREFLEIETIDSLVVAAGRYFFRKRLPHQEQPCIYMREGADGHDRLLVDPAGFAMGKYKAVKPVAVSPDGRVLVYEVKKGGERASCLEALNVDSGAKLPDALPSGYLRAFSFAPDSQSFYYAHDPVDQNQPHAHALYKHKLGAPQEEDLPIFRAGESKDIRLGVVAGPEYVLVFVHRFLDRRVTDCYLQPLQSGAPARLILSGIDFLLSPQFVDDRIIALTNQNAPNYRIVEFRLQPDGTYDFVELVPTRDAMILRWMVLRGKIVVCYLEGTSYRTVIFDLSGRHLGELPLREGETVYLVAGDPEKDEVLLECESFFESISIHRYSVATNEHTALAKAAISLDRAIYAHKRVWYHSKDGMRIPMFLVGRRDVLETNNNPAILTSYGGFRHAMTPQFSVFVAFLMEKGCVFALPNIRGGAEFGAEWHAAAKRHNRQKAFDDFVSAAEWLISSGTAHPEKMAIFGGSNSGLLVGAALTQAPSLFRAVVCIAPLLDMLRYHLFNGATKWTEEFGTAHDPQDFATLWAYSPYHRVTDNVAYPAVMMISGDSDQNCNPLHARKMVARLQAASISSRPIILDYSRHRGHTAVLPLSVRVDALTDRMAFLCDQLGLTV